MLSIYVRDVEDRSNTPKGCNAMYVEDVEDGKRTYTHIFAHNFLNIQLIFKAGNLESWDIGLFKDYLTFDSFDMLWHTSDLINYS